MNIFTAKPIPPLLRRTQLLPGESLPSLLERLAQFNYYPSPYMLSHICHEHLDSLANQDNLACPQWVETFLRLADLTLISPEDLYAASNHRFASLFNPPSRLPVEFPWIGATSKVMLTYNLAYNRLRPQAAAQYCPKCLKTSAYHRLRWVPTAAAICLEHRCLLLNRCQQCHKRISVQEIVRKHCRSCLADLSTVEPYSVEGNDAGILSQQAIQSWLAVVDDAELPCDYPLPSHHPAALYRFLEDLSRRLLIRQVDWPNLPAPLNELSVYITSPSNTRHQLQTMTPGEVFHLQRIAFTGLVNWPNGLFQFLDAYCGYFSPNQALKNREKLLTSIRNDWFQSDWRTPDFEFAQKSFINYLLVRDIPLPIFMAEQLREVSWFAEEAGLYSEKRAAQVLDISTQSLSKTRNCDSLKSCIWPRSHSKILLFDRDKLLALKQKWAQGWTTKETSNWLGISLVDVIGLVKQNVFAIVDKPDVNEASWLLSRQSVEDFFDKVTSQLTLFEGNKRDVFCLDEAAKCVGDSGISRMVLLRCVADGSLPGLKREPKIHYLTCIYFLEDLVWGFPDSFYARNGWVAGRAFANEKGISPRVVFEWMNAGLILPKVNLGLHSYFMRSQLEQLASNHVPDLGQSHYL